jgi:hypothetical protein
MKFTPMPNESPEGVQAAFQQNRVVIVHDIERPIDIDSVLYALEPAKPFGPPVRLSPSTPTGDGGWNQPAKFQEDEINRLLSSSSSPPRFAVFSFAPIPLAIHLGYRLTDRIDVEAFQYHRDGNTWRWPQIADVPAPSLKIEVTATENCELSSASDAVIRVSLSAGIRHTETNDVTGEVPLEVDIGVNDPDVLWLREPAQLIELVKEFRNVLEEIRFSMPRCERIHLFYAGPTPGAIAIGQAINSKMNPSIWLYRYDRQKTPRYAHVLSLGEGRS